MALESAGRTHKISEAGIAAVIAAVDPFHDGPIEHWKGWPDHEQGQSVCRHFKTAKTVKSPDDGGAIMVFTWPILNQAVCHRVVRKNAVVDTITNAATTDATIGPCSIYTYTAAVAGGGGNLPVAAAAGVTQDVLNIPASYFGDGAMRLVGMGVEVHDVTADIYKQGTLTIGTVPQSIADREALTVRAQTVSGRIYLQTNQDACLMQRFPGTLEDMLKYPDSEQWDAREGAYVVVPFTGHENPPVFAEYRTPWVCEEVVNQIDIPGTTALNQSTHMIGPYFAGTVDNEPFYFSPNAYAPVNSRFIYLSGLNANSTFTITTHFYIESFPTQQSNLLPMARVACPCDPKALMLIKNIMQLLPAGCPVADNASGDWFWEAVQTSLPLLEGMAMAAFPQFAPLIRGAGGIANNFLNSRGNEQVKRRAKRNKNKAAIKNEVKQLVKTDLKAEQAQKQKRQVKNRGKK